MEVDTPELVQQESPRASSGSGEDEFDLEAFAAQYEGKSSIASIKAVRLNYVAQHSQALAGAALTLALAAITSSTLDVPLYENTFQMYRQHINAIQSGEIKSPAAIAWYESVKGNEVTADRSWIEATRREAQRGLEKREVELKGYITNLIKESIRMGHRDIARFLHRTGDLAGAIRSYTKSREFCTTSQHVLEMSIGVIEVALEMNNYAFVRNHVVKAESALESINAPPAAGKAKAKVPVTNLPGMVAPALDPAEVAKERERQTMQERLTVASGVAHLGASNYAAAARAFTGIGKETLSSSVNHFVPPADIALYAVLTGLATFDRTELRTRILENADLRPMLDLEPYLRDVLRAFYASKFKEGLDALSKYRVRQQLDIHLSPHLNNLLHLIRNRALLAYFSPFKNVAVKRMASSFGWSEEELVQAVIPLIRNGDMKARIDSRGGVLVAKKKDVRTEAFRHALEEGERIEKRTVAAQFRMRLIKEGLLVKSPKQSDNF
ncbi:COP9 signalosome complex subunit 1 [Pseudohyphozyma bogoriensis]|nr:COP9 signalosome complex subunit 1 [Pseudohyphozyma bogoriensis]